MQLVLGKTGRGRFNADTVDLAYATHAKPFLEPEGKPMTIDPEAVVTATDLLGAHPKRVFAVLIGYFDDSGTHDAAETAVMAGYVAHRSDWKRFEVKSKQLFEREGIPFFRAKLFDHRQKQFKDWSPARQLKFATEWYGIANKHILRGIAAGMLKADFKAGKDKDRKLPGISCEAYCMQMALSHLSRDEEVWKEIEKHSLQVIVESSTVANAGIKVDFNRVIAVNNLPHRIKAISFAPKQDVRALQIGDYLAYYSQRFAETAIHGSFDGVTPFLDIAKEGVKTIMKLGEKFEPNPDYRALIVRASKKKAS